MAMHEAGKLFHAWGVALGVKLQQVLKKEEKSVGVEDEDDWRSQLTGFVEEEAVEDFLDEGILSTFLVVIFVCFYLFSLPFFVFFFLPFLSFFLSFFLSTRSLFLSYIGLPTYLPTYLPSYALTYLPQLLV